jgi:signal transduction histidine kinase
MVVPLSARGKTLGAITLIASDSRRNYTERDLQIAEELGRRAGVAVDNAILYSQLQQAIRTRDEFLSIASHELKTPLTTLMLQSQITQLNLSKGNLEFFSQERLQKFSRQIDSQVGRLEALVEDMLDVSRIQSGKLLAVAEPVDLASLTEIVCEQLSPMATEQGSSIEFSAQETRGIWDRRRIEQVLVNLITNAIKYGEGKPIQVRVYQEDGLAKVDVEDHGLGISPENHLRIFERFERAVSSKGISGLGLGLYISKNILNLHKAEIRLRSELGRGSVFTIELPRNPFGVAIEENQRSE